MRETLQTKVAGRANLVGPINDQFQCQGLMMKQELLTLLLVLSTYSTALAGHINATGPWGVDAGGFKNLSTALASSATAGKTVNVSKPMSINNKVLPADRQIKILRGGRINPASGKVFDFAGQKPEAGEYQIFGGAGTVTGLEEVLAGWFGAVGNGVADDTLAIQKSVNASSKVFLSKKYNVSGVTANGMLHISGGTLIQSKANQNNHMLTLNATGSAVTGVTFIGPVAAGNTNYAGYAAIYLNPNYSPSNVTIDGCKISGKICGILSTNPVAEISGLGDNIKVHGCTIYHAGQAATLYAHPRHMANNIVLDGNKFVLQEGFDPSSAQIRGAQLLWANNSKIINNQSFGSQLSLEVWNNNVSRVSINASAKIFTRLDGGWLAESKFRIGDTVTFSGFKNSGNNGTFTISDITNSILTCADAIGLVDESAVAGFPYSTGNVISKNTVDVWLSFTSTVGGMVEGNIIDGALRPKVHSDYPGGATCGLEIVMSKNSIVNNNVIQNIPQHGLFTGPGFGPSNHAVSSNLLISNNTITNCATGGTLNNGYSGIQLGALHSSVVSNNMVDSCGNANAGYSLSIGGKYIPGSFFDPVYDLIISNNVIRNNKASGTSGAHAAVLFSHSRNVRFFGNSIVAGKSHAMNIGDGFTQRLSVENCTVSNNGGAAIYSNGNNSETVVTGNQFFGNRLGTLTYDGINAATFPLFIKFINNAGYTSDGTILNNCPTTGELGELINTSQVPNKWQRYAVAGTGGSITPSSMASTINGSRNITLNSIAAGNLLEGQYINITGVSGVKKVVRIDRTVSFETGIGSSLAEVDSNCDATVRDAAIAYSAPTIVQVP